MLQIMPIFDLFPGRNTWDPEETRNSSFWLMKAPRYGPFLHGVFLLFPVLNREMRATDASIDVTYEYLFACFIPSFMESFILSSLTRLVTSDEPSRRSIGRSFVTKEDQPTKGLPELLNRTRLTN